MSVTKKKLTNNEVTLGAWIMIGHPTVAEIIAGFDFDWIGVDLEHTSTDYRAFHEICLAVKGTGKDLLARLPGLDEQEAKRLLDAGANGIIVPNINTPEQAKQAVAIAKFPPEGIRGASLCRASDFGRNFKDYYASHNENVTVIVMIEHKDAVANIDAILQTPGIDGTLIGPYDLSSSMGLAGQLDHPDVRAAQQTILNACKKHKIPAGIHVVPVDPPQIKERIDAGYKFVACSLDTEFILMGCREILSKIKA